MRKTQNPEAAAARHPVTRKVHHHGIWSIGPNEEWCVDGHEKLLNIMGVAIWGVIDKYTRMELGLWATPNARNQELPPALYLRVVRKQGGLCIVLTGFTHLNTSTTGMSLSVTADKGTENGLLISLVTTMRYRLFQTEFLIFLFVSYQASFSTVSS